MDSGLHLYMHLYVHVMYVRAMSFVTEVHVHVYTCKLTKAIGLEITGCREVGVQLWSLNFMFISTCSLRY